MRYTYEKTADELAVVYEQINLQEAYDEKKVSLGQIIMIWGLYIVSNAACIFLCTLVAAVAVVLLCDCLWFTEYFMTAFTSVIENPVLYAVITALIMVMITWMVAMHTMRTETIDVEMEVEYI